jgi:hypothetical protein
MPTKLNTEIVAAAIAGFEEQKKRLNAQIAELRQMLNPSATDGSAPTPVRRRMLRRVPELQPLNGRDGPQVESRLEQLRLPHLRERSEN